MPLISPFAAGSILNPEQGGSGVNGDEMTSGYILASQGNGLEALQLVAGAGVDIDFSQPGQIIISSSSIAGGAFNIKTVAAGYVATTDDYTLLVDASGGAIAITLPQAAKSIWVVKKIDNTANAVTVTGVSGLVDSNANLVINVPFASYTMQSDGTNLYIL